MSFKDVGLETSLKDILYSWFETTQYFLSNGITPPLAGLCEDCIDDSHRNSERFSAVRYPMHDLEIIAQYLVGKGFTSEDLCLLARSSDSLIRRLEQLPHAYRPKEREGEPS